MSPFGMFFFLFIWRCRVEDCRFPMVIHAVYRLTFQTPASYDEYLSPASREQESGLISAQEFVVAWAAGMSLGSRISNLPIGITTPW